jgi:hypothetical protein
LSTADVLMIDDVAVTTQGPQPIAAAPPPVLLYWNNGKDLPRTRPEVSVGVQGVSSTRDCRFSRPGRCRVRVPITHRGPHLRSIQPAEQASSGSHCEPGQSIVIAQAGLPPAIGSVRAERRSALEQLRHIARSMQEKSAVLLDAHDTVEKLKSSYGAPPRPVHQ